MLTVEYSLHKNSLSNAHSATNDVVTKGYHPENMTGDNRKIPNHLHFLLAF